jgi:hypothetical protein
MVIDATHPHWTALTARVLYDRKQSANSFAAGLNGVTAAIGIETTRRPPAA